ncbi:MAG TPA: hypothetical protein VGC79_06675, partial [Polyangiaceae bacterium]
ASSFIGGDLCSRGQQIRVSLPQEVSTISSSTTCGGEKLVWSVRGRSYVKRVLRTPNACG